MNNQKIGSLSSKDIESIHSQYLEHIDTGIITEDKGIVICLDVLGWKNYSRPNQIENLTILTAGLESIIFDTALRMSENKENCKIDIKFI